MKLDKKFWTEGPGSFAVAILIALTIRWAFMEAYVIPSGSMLPTLLIHDHIFVNKFVYGIRLPFSEHWLFRASEPKRGEIIVFKYPEDNSTAFIKRVIGVPGDKVFYENNRLYINDELQDLKPAVERKSEINWLYNRDFMSPGYDYEGLMPDGKEILMAYDHLEETIEGHTHSILISKNRSGQRFSSFGPYYVPKDHYFVMGDNRDHSADGRVWSEAKRFVPRENLIGRAMFVWLSCDETLPVVSFLCNPMTIRFKRLLHSVHD